MVSEKTADVARRANQNAEPTGGEYPLLGIGLLVGHRLHAVDGIDRIVSVFGVRADLGSWQRTTAVTGVAAKRLSI